MKLLLDENLSARILGILAGTFPGSQHVAEAGLRGHSDLEIWEFADRAWPTTTREDDATNVPPASRGPSP